MPKEKPQQVTKLLIQWNNGDELALAELMPLIYDELRIIARRYIRQRDGGNTFQTTDLIHEAYLKLVNKDEQEWKNRSHFFGVASKAMRHILVDHARSRLTKKTSCDEYCYASGRKCNFTRTSRRNYRFRRSTN